ncbi:MAG: glycosyltransferase [Gemmatimonadota bacterium]|nr:glycosyltransferase [Gemmatimonadota bacterium]
MLVVMPLGAALGGGEEMLRQLLREGRGQGVEWVVAFLREGPMVKEMRALGVECHVVEAGRFREVWRRAAAVRRLAALARARSVDLCLGWMVAGQAMAGPAALLAGVPCAWYQVGTPRPDWLDRLATLWPAVGVLALSTEGAGAQARIWPRRSVTLVYPGVALDRATAARATPPTEMRARLGLPSTGLLVGTVSRLQRWKGVHVFLDAVAALRHTRPDLHAVVVGGAHETEPGYEHELHDQAARLGIADVVTFAGFQANAIEWMQAMDVVVHAAAREPFGIVIVEAMALGKPVVAGAAGGPAEIVRDGVNGLLVPYGDAPGIARAVQRYLTAPGFAAATGAAAAARAAEFSASAFAANVCRAVRHLVSGAERARA